MASKSAGLLPTKPSFAKIAAMAPPTRSKAVPNTHKSVIPSNTVNQTENINPAEFTKQPVIQSNSLTTATGNAPKVCNVQSLTEGIEGLALVNKARESGGSGNDRDQEGDRGSDSPEDAGSHLSNSSTKPPSFGAKSMASVTTFAMDEKESLRPDDSASVQAADEDEPFSASVSGAAGSQIGSETGLPQLRGLPRDNSTGNGAPIRRFPMITLANPPRFGEIPLDFPADIIQDEAQQPPAAISMNVLPLSDSPQLSVPPDEKLLEAMGTPKDRLYLLQLEQIILAFLTQSKDEICDLPPQNSFGRLLAHKLADYYNLAHFITNDNSAVRIIRTPCCRLPTPLGMLASSMPAVSTPPTGSAAVKIMRRNLGNGKLSAGASTPASSSVPSKAASETGADTTSDEGIKSPLDSTPAKDKSKWTREEKESYYKAARERIFKDFQETNASENNSTGETPASMSRSSSSSGKKKSHKQRAPKDDSFEARSSFIPGYAGMTFSSTSNQYSHTIPSPPYPQPFTNSTANVFGGVNYPSAPNQTFPTYEPAVNYNGVQSFPAAVPQQYPSNEGWSNPQSPQPGGYYNFNSTNQQSVMYPQHSSNISPQPMNPYPQSMVPSFHSNNGSWTQNTYSGSFQQSVMASHPSPVHWPNYPPPSNVASPPPYQFGQLPPQSYTSTPPSSNQHPIPGSFNRSVFNPQTRSFVPGSSASRFTGKGNHQKAAIPFSGSQTSNGSAGYVPLPDDSGMLSSLSSRSSPMASHGPSSPKPQIDSIQKKWGTPAHLPKKPPPSQVPSAFDIDTTPTLPSLQVYQGLGGNAGKGSPLIVSGGGVGFPNNVTGGLAAGS